VGYKPGFAPVVAAVYFSSFNFSIKQVLIGILTFIFSRRSRFRFLIIEESIEDIGMRGADGQADASDVSILGEAVYDFFPGFTAIAGFVDGAPFTAFDKVSGFPFPLPGCSIEDSRILRVHSHIDNTGFRVDIENFFPGFTAISGFK